MAVRTEVLVAHRVDDLDHAAVCVVGTTSDPVAPAVVHLPLLDVGGLLFEPVMDALNVDSPLRSARELGHILDELQLEAGVLGHVVDHLRDVPRGGLEDDHVELHRV